MSKISRLWRKLGATEPVFYFGSNGHAQSWTDGDLRGLTMTRGLDDPVGITKNTATIKVKGAIEPVPMADASLAVRLTDYGQALIEGRIGKGPFGGAFNHPVRERFFGRVAGMEVTDTGDRNPDRWETAFTCGDWASTVTAINNGATITRTVNDNPITKLVASMISRGGSYHTPAPTQLGTQFHNVNWKAGDADTLIFDDSKVESHFITELGYLLRTTRDNTLELLDVNYRQDRATNIGQYAPQPLTRACCVRPVSWTQRVTLPGGVQWTQSDGTTYTVWVGGSGSTAGIPLEKLDMSDVFVIGSLYDAMTARMYRSVRSGYCLQSVQVDVLDLFNRDDSGQRDLLAQLLTMEPGDPLAFGNDWPADVAGIYTLTRITEDITPGGWRLTLDVAPISWATGKSAPLPRFATWDTAYPTDEPWTGPSATWETTP